MKKKSWIWKYIVAFENAFDEIAGYRCEICKTVFSKDIDVSSFIYHLVNVDKE